MIPISLSLKGLYSYQEEQTIDFTRLLEGQLFGIFGSVGSGKSSILEAISFALYGQTERLGDRDNRNYNMMNLKSEDLLIDFTFKNFKENLYRYTVKGKRNGKNFDKVNTFERAGYQWVNEAWQPLESANAESILGLSYVNFRRTIIIPQGQFQEFLQLKPNDRTQMLKEIFQLERYEFFYQTKHLETKNNQALQHLTGQLSTYTEIQEERIKEQHDLVKALAHELEKGKKLQQEKMEQFTALSQLKTLTESLHLQEKTLHELQLEQENFLALDLKIKKYEYCTLHFKHELDRDKDLRVLLQEKKSTQSTLKIKWESLKEQIVSLAEPIILATEEYAKQDKLKEKLQDYHLLRRLVSLQQEIQKSQSRIDKGEISVAQVLKNKEIANVKQQQVKQSLQEHRARMPDVTVLVEIRAWFDQKASLSENLQKLALEISRLKDEEKKIQDDFSILMDTWNLKEINSKTSLERVAELLVNLKTESDRALEEFQAEDTHFNVQLKLSEYSEALKRGEPCPVCGSLSHVHVLELGDVELGKEKVSKAIQQERSKQTSLSKMEKELQKHQSNLGHLLSNISQLDGQLKAQEASIGSHQHSFQWQEYDPERPDVVTQKLLETASLRNTIKTLEQDLEQQEQLLQKTTKEHDRYVDSLNQIKAALLASVTESNTLIKQLRQHHESDIEKSDDEALLNLELNLRKKIEHDKLNFDNLNLKLSTLKEQELKTSLQLESLDLSMKSDEKSLLQIDKTLKEHLKNSLFSDLQEVNQILEEPFLVDEAKGKLNHYHQQVYSVTQRVKDLSLQTAGQSFDAEGYELLTQELDRMKADIDQGHDAHIKEKSTYETWLAKWQTKSNLLKDLEHLELRAENIKVMMQLFKGNGFINYISTVYLENLCQEANVRFYQLTHQQLQLELGDKNEFLVRDFMNNGKLRSVKTLSGGQTFQASLCLALALAESVQQQNQSKQNFFFLDEGFGSLDKDSLQMAFETLKSLRKENRIVGVISHVEDLQQEIDVYLKIINDPFTGSKVVKSWLV